MMLNPNSINPDPSARVLEHEFKVLFIKFCALICIMHNKKLNLANIFLLVLKDKKVKSLYKSVCDFECDYEALRCFLEYDNTLHKSKYIKKYLNAMYGNASK